MYIYTQIHIYLSIYLSISTYLPIYLSIYIRLIPLVTSITTRPALFRPVRPKRCV